MRLIQKKTLNNLFDNLNNIFDFSQKLISSSRKILLKAYRSKFDVQVKQDSSPVTLIDRRVEKKLRTLITDIFPNHSIIGEEYPSINLQSPYKWVIDPIDGTRAFITGKPTFGTLIALYKEDEPIFGIIDMPVLDELWLGIKNHGCFCNNKKVTVSNINNISKATIVSSSPDAFNKTQLKLYNKIKKNCLRSVWGGDCHNYGLLAGGFLDIVIECNLKWHDIAALIPIVEEAGGIASDFCGRKLTINGDGNILACNSKIVHSQVLEILSKNG